MKALIVYATKHGATKQIAEQLAEYLGGADLVDVGAGETASLTEYDCVLLGSPLTAGSIRKEVGAFVRQHAGELGGKRLGLFVSGLQGEDEDSYFQQNFPPELLAAARAKAFLGGVFDPAKCGFVARKIIKAASKLEGYTNTIDPARVEAFARELAR